jgi:hypothetical protein
MDDPVSERLAPGPLLAARLLVLYPFLSGSLGMIRPRPGVGAIAVLDNLSRVPEPLWLLVSAVYLGAAVAVWLGHRARLAAIVSGSVILFDVVVALGEYANNRLLVGLVLVLIGLADETWGTWPIRSQLAVMYAGAALNKLLDGDWRSGRFMENWTEEVLDLSFYTNVADRWSNLHLALSWVTIVVEAALAALILMVHRTRLAIILVLTFHGGMLLLTEGTVSWLFGYGVAATLVALTEPRRMSPIVVAALGFWALERVVA